MCGINGFNFEDERLIKLMNKKINHRGPDDSDFGVLDNLSLGQVRLSIIDLSDAGIQPMFYNKKLGASNSKFNSQNIKSSNFSIVFNGEIYNYLEIRKKLEYKGYTFSTKTDTEVILASYLEWGERCVNRFNGMWSFCIHDKKRNILFCSRDRLGQKPFYYYNKGDKFIFSSELKGILEHKSLRINKKENLNKESIELYFSLGFIPSPHSIFKDVFKLEASYNLVYDLGKNKIINYYRYYQISDFKPIYNKNKLIEEGRKLLKDATKLRMRSDVEVGAFLSGGLDSSSIVGEMRELTDISKLHTFSIGFEGKDYDETKFVNIVKNDFKTKHHHYYLKEKDFQNLIDDFSQVYDEPFGDYSGFPTIKISELAKKDVTVCLSGDGGDEIFAGYERHVLGVKMDLLKKIPRPLRILGSKIPAKKNLNSFASLYLLKKAFDVSLLDNKYFYSNSAKDSIYKPLVFRKWSKERLSHSLEKGNYNLAEGFRIYDLLYNSLSDNFLVKVDRASMSSALEVRSPFLDYRFIEFAQKIPTKYKIDILTTKKLMREIIKGIVPEDIYKRKDKMGFTPPIEKWILKGKYEKELSRGLELLKEIDEDIYKYYQEKVFKENNKVYTQDKIRLFIFNKWYEKWVR